MEIRSISSVHVSYNNVQKSKHVTFKRNWAEHASWGANYIKESGKTNFKLFSFPDAKAVFVEIGNKLTKGFGNIKDRVVQIMGMAGAGIAITNVVSKDDETKVYPMEHKGNGVFEAKNVDAEPDDKYRYIVVTKDNKVNLVKDPYAKKQEDINGWSSVYNPDNYEWKNTDWLDGKDERRIVRKPNEPLRGLEKLIIDEVNIPTLTEEGTFESAKKRIDVIAKRGVATAIELMPVENTFSKQWGYDGVDKFAVNEKLGGAKQLKELIDYAHGLGLNVIMDMVPNHMGPDGDYLKEAGPYEAGDGQFGAKLNYEGTNNRYVRDWMTNAALWWANEFKVDGIRFDMTKETASDYLLKQMVIELNEHNPNVFTIAEDGRNNKLSVTRYDDTDDNWSHEDSLEFIDMNIDLILNKKWRTTPHAIGFDSEWDFPFMHALKKAILNNNQISLDDIDSYIGDRTPRLKYVMSHDEIGNEDGTRLIPKFVSQNLNIFHNITGIDDADRGQKAAQLSQKLVEMIISNKDIKNTELVKVQREYGCTATYDKNTLTTSLQAALAKQRLAQGTVMTIPGPKMYFQGDDNAEIAHFKFFREFSDEKANRAASSDFKNRILREKGYDTSLEEGMQDSIIDRIKPDGIFQNLQENMIKYNQDLRKIIDENPALESGEVSSMYKMYDKQVHLHTLKKDDNEILVIKNYADVFHKNNFSSLGFPQNGNWVEILNSDNTVYGGGGLTNENNTFNSGNQNLNVAANSIVILKRVN